MEHFGRLIQTADSGLGAWFKEVEEGWDFNIAMVSTPFREKKQAKPPLTGTRQSDRPLHPGGFHHTQTQLLAGG